MELFFEVFRGKQHIMVDTRESGTVSNIKDVISGIMQVPISDITLKRPINDSHTAWETIESDRALLDFGYTQKTAKPDDPAPLTYTLPGDNDVVNIESISEAPPLHEAMQATAEY